jgi:hypothetical protein
MSDERDPSGAAEKEAQMREHEREAREREAAERSPEGADDETGTRPVDPESRAADPAGPDAEADEDRDDPRAGKPAPPGSMNIGGGISGGT